ncbi:hypothetical protein Fmac_020035 [Flemingia macrophylla]|uniref:Uncharacterized protein n=1 Tax=Flemingia macrophylla TaxID=520843 RepID=A0ABD1M9I1_9FABA
MTEGPSVVAMHTAVHKLSYNFGVVVAHEVDIDFAINPMLNYSQQQPEIYGVAHNYSQPQTVEEAGNYSQPQTVNSNTEEEAINPMVNYSQPQAYESPRFKRFVTHCSSHVAETCSAKHEAGGGANNLSLCLFDSMESCLVDHGASLTSSPNKSLFQYQSIRIETIKFRSVMRTCSHVSASRCSNFAASELQACLVPTINQCVYPGTGAAESGAPPIARIGRKIET